MNGTQSETEITRLVLKELTFCGCFAFKHWGGPMGRKGVSDILGVLPGGRALAVEVKRPGGKPTSSQADFLKEVSQAGGLALVITSVEEIRAAQERLF